MRVVVSRSLLYSPDPWNACHSDWSLLWRSSRSRSPEHHHSDVRTSHLDLRFLSIYVCTYRTVSFGFVFRICFCLFVCVCASSTLRSKRKSKGMYKQQRNVRNNKGMYVHISIRYTSRVLINTSNMKFHVMLFTPSFHEICLLTTFRSIRIVDVNTMYLQWG